jgi:hypothetical protein
VLLKVGELRPSFKVLATAGREAGRTLNARAQRRQDAKKKLSLLVRVTEKCVWVKGPFSFSSFATLRLRSAIPKSRAFKQNFCHKRTQRSQRQGFVFFIFCVLCEL